MPERKITSINYLRVKKASVQQPFEPWYVHSKYKAGEMGQMLRRQAQSEQLQG